MIKTIYTAITLLLTCKYFAKASYFRYDKKSLKKEALAYKFYLLV